MQIRKIIHIDMDAFFASIEQRDHPEYRNRPLIVAGPAEARGVVSTASYEARKFGVHSAMPTRTAQRLCPNGIFTRGDMKKYREVSHQIRDIFSHYTDLVEPLSIDEAFLDVTQNSINEPSAARLALQLQKEIYEQTCLTASAGVSYNKFLAKIASDYRKPYGLTVIPPYLALDFIAKLPIEKFYGVGKVTAEHFRNLGIHNGLDLRNATQELLIREFGKSGSFFYRIARGIDDREVDPSESRKSVGRETTFHTDIDDMVQIHQVIAHLATRVAALLHQYQLAGKTVTLKVRYDDFSTLTRSLTHSAPVAEASAIEQSALWLLNKTDAGVRKVRLLGVTVSGFPEIPDDALLQPELPLDWRDDTFTYLPNE